MSWQALLPASTAPGGRTTLRKKGRAGRNRPGGIGWLFLGRWQLEGAQLGGKRLVEFVQILVVDGTGWWPGQKRRKGTILCRVAPSGFEPLGGRTRS